MTFSVMWVQNQDAAVSIDDQPVLTATKEMVFTPMVKHAIIATDTDALFPEAHEVIRTSTDDLVGALDSAKRRSPWPVWVVGTADFLDAAVRHPSCVKIVTCTTTARTHDADEARTLSVPHEFSRFSSSNLPDQHMVLAVWTREGAR